MIYPNPLKNELIIKNNYQLSVLINIIDLYGRIWNSTSIGAHNEIIINISSLPSGLYIIKYIYEDSRRGYKSIIKE